MSIEQMSIGPCHYFARASSGDVVLAESSAARRVEVVDGAPQLWFPLADVRLDALHDDGGGRWSIEGAPGATDRDAGQDSWFGRDETTPGDRPVLVAADGEAPAELDGLAVFDHDRVRVELVDPGPGGGPADITVKRFPTWGDAADLADLLAVRPDGPGAYVSACRSDWRRPVVEASQMLGQGIVAASRHTGGRRVVSGHMVFPRAADARVPLRVELDELSAGRTFTALAVSVGQGDRRCGVGTLLLDETAPDVVRHTVAPPDVPGPYDSQPLDMGVTGRDIRVVDGAYTSDPDAPVGPPVLDAWVRFAELPDDPALHAGLLAQFTGHLSIAAALRPHAGIGQQEAHRTLSTAINAIAISLHRDVRADRWMLYHHHSTFAGDGMTHAECRVHDEDGDLIASFTVDAMVRRFAEGTSGAARSSL